MSAPANNTTTPSSAQHTGLKFVHTADLHLDSPLRSLALLDNDLAAVVESATRTALVRIVDLCINEQVDALLIAGDLYDSDQKSMHTAALLINQMRRLHQASIPVFIIRGNHDFQSAITKRLKLPENVHVFSSRGQSIELAGKSTYIHGASFAKKHVPESLLPKFKSPIKDAINIGMLHTSLSGTSEHDVYAPCSVKELDEFGYDYWALGHIHKRSEQGSNTKIVMPGIPQGRDIGEQGPGTASLVTITNERVVSIDNIVVGPAQFESISVDLSAITDWNIAVNAIQQRISTLREQSAADHLIVRVILSGETELHFKLNRDITLLQEVLREYFANNSDVWIEKIKCETSTVSSESLSRSGQNNLPDLHDIINNEVLGSDNINQQASKEIELFVSKLPAESKHLFGETEEQRKTVVETLLREGSQLLLQSVATADES